MQGKVRATAGKRRHRHADGHGSHDREGPLRDLPDSPYRLIFRWPEGVGQRAVGPALAEMEASLAPKWGEMWARLAKKFAQKSPRQVPRFMSRSATCGPTPSGSSSWSPTRAGAPWRRCTTAGGSRLGSWSTPRRPRPCAVAFKTG